MNLFEIKLTVINKRAEAVNALLNINSDSAAEYRKQQGIIQGIDICLGIITQGLKEEDDA